MSQDILRIGALARLSGATPKALRLYEALGLIPEPRRQGSYRVYEQRHLDAVRLIRQAQAVGFKLQELRALTASASRPAPGEPLARDVALQAVQAKRAALAAQQQRLQLQLDELAVCERLLLQAFDCPDVQPA